MFTDQTNAVIVAKLYITTNNEPFKNFKIGKGCQKYT